MGEHCINLSAENVLAESVVFLNVRNTDDGISSTNETLTTLEECGKQRSHQATVTPSSGRNSQISDDQLVESRLGGAGFVACAERCHMMRELSNAMEQVIVLR